MPARARLSLLRKGALGATVGALLCAPLAIAAIGYFHYGDVGTHASTFYGSAHVPADGLPQLLMPYIYGPILEFTGPSARLTGVWVVVGGYLSISLLLLAGLGLISRARRGLQAVLGVWIVLVFARMYGQIPLLGHILGLLPGMARIAFFRYGTPALEFGVIILAAIGLDDIICVPEHRRRLLWGSLAMIALIAVAAVGARSLADQLGAKFQSRPYFELAVAWGALVVIALALVGTRLDAARRAPALCAVVAIDALALFVAPQPSAPRSVQIDTAPIAYLRSHLGQLASSRSDRCPPTMGPISAWLQPTSTTTRYRSSTRTTSTHGSIDM